MTNSRIWRSFVRGTRAGIGAARLRAIHFSQLAMVTTLLLLLPGVVRAQSAGVWGDVNGDGRVTAIDAQAVLAYVVGLPLPAGYTAANGDSNCSSSVSALDAQIVLAYAVGNTVTQFCVGKQRTDIIAASMQLFLSAPSVIVGSTVEATASVKNAAGSVLSSAVVTYTTDNVAVANPGVGGEINALSAGTVTITASSGTASATAPLTVAAAPVTAASWTFCVAAGNVCEFAGLRLLRLGAVNGPFVQQAAFHQMPCALASSVQDGFAGADPAPGKTQHCDYGPILTTVLNNPAPGMVIAGATVTVPLGSAGTTQQRIRATAEQPISVPDEGSFRTTCDLAMMAFDDPIVFPNQPGASHLHAFFGNTAVRASTTPTSVASTGGSTCIGGIANRTGYWVAALVDTLNGEVQIPDLGIFYYKSGYNMDPTSIQPFPVGLRMIAGDKTATSTQPNTNWSCRDQYTGDFASIPTNCPVNDFVRMEVQFPQCWDGVNLDSPDHKSHMAFAISRNPPLKSSCPTTHPIPLPAITEKFDYPVTGKFPARWRLTSDMYSSTLKGGLSAHADWMNGWIPSVMQTIVTKCINKSVDCLVGNIGNGTELY
jgi:hypothetical protein